MVIDVDKKEIKVLELYMLMFKLLMENLKEMKDKDERKNVIVIEIFIHWFIIYMIAIINLLIKLDY